MSLPQPPLQQLMPTCFLHTCGMRAGLSLKEQAQEFAAADILVGMHGAALVNMIFMPAHAVLIEVRGPACHDLVRHMPSTSNSFHCRVKRPSACCCFCTKNHCLLA